MPTVEQQTFQPTAQQLQAITHVHGPMLVVAGAGTGKTTVLSQRIAHLIRAKLRGRTKSSPSPTPATLRPN